MLWTQLCWTKLEPVEQNIRLILLQFQYSCYGTPGPLVILISHKNSSAESRMSSQWIAAVPPDASPPPPSSQSWLSSIRYGRHSAGREHKQTVEEEPRPQIFFNYPIFVFVALESFTCGVLHRKRSSAGSRFCGVAEAPPQSFTSELQRNLNNDWMCTPTT